MADIKILDSYKRTWLINHSLYFFPYNPSQRLPGLKSSRSLAKRKPGLLFLIPLRGFMSVYEHVTLLVAIIPQSGDWHEFPVHAD
jgi:hypothetical protein